MDTDFYQLLVVQGMKACEIYMDGYGYLLSLPESLAPKWAPIKILDRYKFFQDSFRIRFNPTGKDGSYKYQLRSTLYIPYLLDSFYVLFFIQ